MKTFVLVLDDNLRILDIVKKGLDKERYTVVAYSDPSEALKYFQESSLKYNLILTDIEMPVMTGFEFIEKALKIAPGIKTIGMSGSKNIDLHKDRFNNFIEKPFGITQLRKVIADTLL